MADFDRSFELTLPPTDPPKRIDRGTYRIALRKLHQGCEDGKHQPAPEGQGGQAPSLPPPLLPHAAAAAAGVEAAWLALP